MKYKTNKDVKKIYFMGEEIPVKDGIFEAPQKFDWYFQKYFEIYKEDIKEDIKKGDIKKGGKQ